MGFHLNQKKTQEELVRLEILLSEINQRYEESDVIVYADLNVNTYSNKFNKFKDKISISNFKIFSTSQPTRKGYG